MLLLRAESWSTAPLLPLPCGKVSTPSLGLLSCLRFSVLDRNNSLDKVNGIGVVKREICINVVLSHVVCTSVCGFHMAFLPSANKERGYHSSSKKEDDKMDFMIFILLSELPSK